MTINKMLCPAGLKNNPNKNLTSVSFITIHCTGNYNATATAKAHAEYQHGGSGGSQASWHYTVDAKDIWQSFEDTRECWHAGDGTNGPGNSTSIGIEICVNDRNGFINACRNAAELTASLLKKHGLALDRVVQHNKWSGKNCPAELRSGAWGIDWRMFMSSVEAWLDEPSPTTGTPIMGASVLTAERLAAVLLAHNPAPKIPCDAVQFARYYIDEGEIEGVRGDMAFFQSVLETGWFGFVNCDVKPEQFNYCGLGATGGGVGGASFERVEFGIRAQTQHLKAYASKEPLKLSCIDPRFHLVTRGIASVWEDLNGKWAVPGDGYGQRIVELHTSAIERGADGAGDEPTVAEMLAKLMDGSAINTPEYWFNALTSVEHFDWFVRALYGKYET